MILFLCSNYGLQSEKKLEFDHRKKLLSLQVKKVWKMLEIPRRDFRKSTENNEVFSFGKIPKWPKSWSFSEFLFFKRWCFLQAFCTFFPQASRNAKSIVPHFRKIDLKKNLQNTIREFHGLYEWTYFSKKGDSEPISWTLFRVRLPKRNTNVDFKGTVLLASC